MMGDIVYRIENNNLYMDASLVEYNSLPIFFVCKDDKGCRYLVLCIDMDKYEYYIAKVKIASLLTLIKGITAMRDVFVQCEIFWKLLEGDDFSSDLVNRIEKSELDCALLPIEGATYEICSEDIRNYCDELLFENEHSNDWLELQKYNAKEEVFSNPVELGYGDVYSVSGRRRAGLKSAFEIDDIVYTSNVIGDEFYDVYETTRIVNSYSSYDVAFDENLNNISYYAA